MGSRTAGRGRALLQKGERVLGYLADVPMHFVQEYLIDPNATLWCPGGTRDSLEGCRYVAEAS